MPAQAAFDKEIHDVLGVSKDVYQSNATLREACVGFCQTRGSRTWKRADEGLPQA